MRAGVARRDDGVGVDEQLSDGVDVAVADADHEHARAEVVLEDPVGEHVGRVPAARRREVGERLAQPRLELRFGHLDEADTLRVLRGEEPAGARVPLRAGRGTPLGIAEQPRALGVVGRVGDLVPLRDAS